MYCPNCATPLASEPSCPRCGLETAPVLRLLRGEPPADRWSRQRRALGTLTVLCSLLLGCLIPVSLALFAGRTFLTLLILLLAGMAGVLLLIGSMLLMAADGLILTGGPARRDAPRALPAAEHYAEQAREPAPSRR